MIKTEISGIDNEKNIVGAINNKQYCELNKNLQKFIKELFPEIKENDVVKVNSLGGIYKRDLEIIYNNKSIRSECEKRSRK